MKKLLVGSVFAPTPRNTLWYELQLRFLQRTLGDSFDHVVAAIRIPTELFERSTVVHWVPPSQAFDYSEAVIGYRKIIEHFASNKEYEHYLILDSDAFPFRDNWLDELLQMMEAKPEQGLPRRRIASAMRCENLDTFPHACALFIEGDYLRSCAPENRPRLIVKRMKNLMGFELNDMMLDDADLYDHQGNQIWLPLVRTNTWNPHPIMAAVYGHMFYHQGAGSRIPHFRAVDMGIFDNYLSSDDHLRISDALFEWLQRDAVGLCSALTAPFEGTTVTRQPISLAQRISRMIRSRFIG